jgi:hypothetical protein
MFLKYGLKIDILRFAASSQLPSPHLHGEGVGVVEGKADVLQVVGEGKTHGEQAEWPENTPKRD